MTITRVEDRERKTVIWIDEQGQGSLETSAVKGRTETGIKRQESREWSSDPQTEI